MKMVDGQKCGDFKREVDLHFELYRHFVNWLEGLYGEDIGSGVSLSELGKKIVEVVPEVSIGEFKEYFGKRTDLAFYTTDEGKTKLFCPVEVKGAHIRAKYRGLDDFLQGAEQAYYLGFTLWFGLCSPDNFVLVDSFKLFDALDWNLETLQEQYMGMDWNTYILEEISLAEMECKEATREILVLLHSKCSEEAEE